MLLAPRRRLRPGCVPQEPSADVRGCRSPDRNDHKTDVRRVLYPWHPWYGQQVIVRQTRAGDRGVLRCKVDDDRMLDNREIRLWMFDAARCARMVPTSQPQVSWVALLELRRLLDETRPEEKPAAIEDRCPSTTEGTDATSTGTTRRPRTSRHVRDPASTPRWPDLPHDTRMTVMELLAELLGGRAAAASDARGGGSMSEKLTTRHLERRAIVYVRQSSPHQLATTARVNAPVRHGAACAGPGLARDGSD